MEERHDDLIKSLLTIRDYTRLAMGRFTEAGLCYGHGTDNAWDEAIALIFHLLNLPHDADDRVLDARLTPNERRVILRMIETRCHEKIPVAYLTNRAWFAGLEFIVDERVLVPRSPIAELIERGFSPWLNHEVSSVLDLCTGSGCIGIACALHLDASVDLVDISPDALEVARQNVARHQLANRARLLQSDLFEAAEGPYDLIVSNPPYVDAQDLANMPAEYHHEPRLGLQAGDDGLDFARQILSQSARYLSEQGVLVLEVGNSADALETAFPDLAFTWVEFSRGGHGVCVLDKSTLQQHFAA
ncbi:MAG: 50S ribosomal protein L3 N(5)-glutamine methyltransferase [Pseudomonadales bacterium]|nr:50S ribosomal protein L3 N(5)-glutamine methyltransferase [Pseudomonadales bacterium]